MRNSNPGHTYNLENMEEYLRNYDVLHHKYFWDRDTVTEQMFDQAISLEERHVVLDRTWGIEKAQDVFLTVQKIYDDDTLDHLGIIQLANDKFIGDFVGIEGIDRLFRESYFYFEWMMHLEYNKDRRDYSYYRDHYIHQIKNMYEMLTLLDEHGFMEKCIDIYKKSTTTVAEYIRASVREEIRYSDEDQKALFKEIVEVDDRVNDRMEDCYYRYILHSASIIAALVHDIGYPINFMLRTAKTLHEFSPLSESFLHINDAMPHLEEILQGSLLYKTVDPNQIAKRIRDKQDHGAISAVILLSQYYEAGAIFHLRPIEKMAIELAALVIYNHTLRYGYMTGEKEELYRNFFDENPLSYLFRLCDDIQEWGRVYFDINKKSNFIICRKCHMPITKELDEENKINYTCLCGISIDKRTKFTYRKLIHISACQSVSICREKVNKKDESRKGEIKPFTIRMDYDLITLLQLSYYSPEFAMQRADGIYEVKKMLDDQNSLPPIYVDTFLTNNPIAIKVKCLEQYLEQIGKKIYKVRPRMRKEVMEAYGIEDDDKKKDDKKEDDKKDEDHKEQYSDVNYKKRKEIIKQVVQYLDTFKESSGNIGKDLKDALDLEKVKEKLKWNYESSSLSGKLQQNLYFYYWLAVIGNTIEAWRKERSILSRKKLFKREVSINLAEMLANDIADIFKIKDRPTKVLIMDYILLRWRHISREEFMQCNNDPEIKLCYHEMGLPNRFIMDMVKEYVDSGAYFKIKTELNYYDSQEYKETEEDRQRKWCDSLECVKKLEGIYDFYTDYELFTKMVSTETT